MAQVESQPAADMGLHPSPVLLEAVLKVEQVVSRLQNLQSTISGIQLSPVNLKHARASRSNATSTRAFGDKDCDWGKENAGPTQRGDECRWKSLQYPNADSQAVLADQPLKSKDWKQWSSPANQVHDVIREILMASEFAKQIATLVAETLQDGGPQKKQQGGPAAEQQSQEVRKKVPKDGKRRDITFPSKAQVEKTMSAKAPPSKPVSKFKVALPSEKKLAPPAKLSSRVKELSISKAKLCSPRSSPPHGCSRVTRANWTNPLSPSSVSPSSLPHSPETTNHRGGRQKLFSSPIGISFSFREASDDADDELAGPRRHSMNVTEIKGSVKPWKLTPTKGVLFSNPVYLESSSPPKLSPARPSPLAPTTGRRRRSSWLPHQFPKPQARCSPDRKLRSSTSGIPHLASSISKVTFKREGSTKTDVNISGSSKREQVKARKVAPPARYVEMVPLDGPQDSSLVTVLDVLKVRSPSRRLPNVSRLDAAIHSVTSRSAVANRRGEVADQCRVPHSHTLKAPTPVAKPVIANSKQPGSFDSSDKENAPIPSCAPSAAKFLRSMSSGHSLNRTLSRKKSAVALLQRAKGWVTSQVVRQGRVRELDRFPETNVVTSTRRYSLPGQLKAPSTSMNWRKLVSTSKTKDVVQPSKTRTQPVHRFRVYFPDRVTPSGAYDTSAEEEVVRYPSGGVMKPVLGSSLFPGCVETFMPGPHDQWTQPPPAPPPSTLNLRRIPSGAVKHVHVHVHVQTLKSNNLNDIMERYLQHEIIKVRYFQRAVLLFSVQGYLRGCNVQWTGLLR